MCICLESWGVSCGVSEEKKNVAWVCQCGEYFAETGDGSGWGQWTNHCYQPKMKGEDCAAVGLVDLETGELLVEAQGMRKSMQEAEKKGYIDKDRPNKGQKGNRKQSKKESVDVSELKDGSKKARKGSQRPSNLEALTVMQRVPLSPAIYSYKGLTDSIVIKPDGTPYGWDEEDFAAWVENMIELAAAVIMNKYLPYFLNTTDEQAEKARASGFVERLLAFAKGIPPEEAYKMLKDNGVPEDELEDIFVGLNNDLPDISDFENEDGVDE